MAQDLEAPTPGFAHAFLMTLERADPVTVGDIATGGRRIYVPVVGGRFEGEGLSGRLVAGGEMLLQRADGVTVVEASYYIAFADGAVARCFGNGYRTNGGDFTGMRLSLLFEAAESGSVASLATRAFVGEMPDGSPTLSISRII